MQLQTTAAERRQSTNDYIEYMRKRQAQFDREANVVGFVLAFVGLSLISIMPFA